MASSTQTGHDSDRHPAAKQRFVSLRPLTARTFRRFRSQPSIYDDAAETVELCPAGVQELEPAVALPGEFERICAVDEHSTWETQRERVMARALPTRPTLLHRLRDVAIHDGTVLTARNVLVLRNQKRRPFIDSVDVEAETALLASDSVIEEYFGHWIRDGLCIEQLAHDEGIMPILPRRPSWLHEPGYRKLLPWPDPAMVSTAWVKSLWIVDDRGFSAHRTARMQRLKSHIRRAASETGPRAVFLRRGSTGKARTLVNEQAVIDHLAARGVAILAPEECQPHEIVEALANAEIAIGIEGSAINHANLAMPANSAVLVIQPPHRFNALGRPVAALCGQRYGFVVGDPAGDHSFSVDLGRLRRTIDLTMR
jgi:hypothetical protein